MNPLAALARQHWLVAGAAGVIAAYLLGAVLHRVAGYALWLGLAALLALVVWTFLGSRDAVAARTRPVAPSIVAKPEPENRKVGKTIDPATFAACLIEGPPIGLSPAFAREIAQTLHAFQVSTAPPKPWSLLLTGPEDWVLEEFERRFCRSLGGQPRIPALECTTLAELSLDELTKAVRRVPVFVVRAAERLRQHPSANRVTAHLEVILQGRQTGWNRVAILMLETVQSADNRYAVAAVGTSLDSRQQLRDCLRAISMLPVGHVHAVAALQPLTGAERVTVLWRDFRRIAAAEYQVAIPDLEDLDQAEDACRIAFLEQAFTTWNEHGVQAAQAFVRNAAQQALAAACLAGVKRAAPHWEGSELRLRPL